MSFELSITLISTLLMLFSLNWALQLLGYLKPMRIVAQAACTRTSTSRQMLVSIEWRPCDSSRGNIARYAH